MTTRQIAYRIKSEGKAEVVRDAKEVGEAFRGAYGQAEAGAAAATSAADRLEQKYRRQAQAAKEAASAGVANARFDAVLGVGGPSAGSARDSAAVFVAQAEAMEAAEARAKALRASIDPLGAAQDRLNAELAEYQRLAAAGQITTKELAQAQAQARQRFDETAASIQRQERGLSRLAVSSRLNLARQGADVAVTAAMGMNPAMIAIQQGPQILDAWATSGLKLNAALLLTGGALAATAAAAGLAAFAWHDAEAQGLLLQKAVTGLGRASGLNAVQVERLAMATAEAEDVSRRYAREAAAAYASTGKIGQEILGDLIALTRDWASVTGKDAGDAALDLAAKMADPDKAARDLTRSMGLLDQKTLEQIESLTKSGETLEAQKILLEALTDAVGGHASQVGAIESAWDAAGRGISDYLDKLGQWLLVTPEEELAYQRRIVERQRGYDQSRPGVARATQEAESRLWVLETQAGTRRLATEGLSNNAEANREAQAAEDRRRAGAAEADRRARAARAAAERAEREAERERREALARQRREEDRQADRDLQIAQALGDRDRVREIERAVALRDRERELIDDGVAADQARALALGEQSQLLAAQAVQRERESALLGDQVAMEMLREQGNFADLKILEHQAERQKKITEYQDLGHDLAEATRLVETDLLFLAEGRAAALERQEKSQARAHALSLARASGDDSAVVGLERADWIDRRAWELATSREMNIDDAQILARSQWAEQWEAEMTGARRRWLTGFLDDVRRGDIGEAIGNQLERAADRMVDKLVDQLMEIDWAGLVGGGRSGGFNWGGLIASFFGSGNTAASFASQDRWTSLLSGSGPAGVSLFDLTGGSVASRALAAQPQKAALSAAAGGSAAPAPFVFAPVIHAEGAGPREIDALRAQMDELARSLPNVVPKIVADAQARRLLRSPT